LLKELHQGTLLEPEASATAFYCVERLSNTPDPDTNWLELELTGPGVLQSRRLYIAGMEQNEATEIIATRGNYPLGIDVYLIDMHGQCAGLPRTTKILSR
jgi:alpha-D-ribose 1-methylphosphonate 5-triphosphate synthase subunit PhnH